jgi:hypothetical protein
MQALCKDEPKKLNKAHGKQLGRKDAMARSACYERQRGCLTRACAGVDVQEHALNPIRIGGTAAQSAIIIGSSPAILAAAIDHQLADAKQRGEVHEIVAFDAPKRALRKLISEGADERVGGSIQQAWATAAGFEIISNMEPITPRPPSPRNAGLFILGFDN